MKNTQRLENGGRAQEAAQQIVAYLTYAMADVRKLSPLGAYLLEMSIAVLNGDVQDGEFKNGVATKLG
jgi:hypothetical protein